MGWVRASAQGSPTFWSQPCARLGWMWAVLPLVCAPTTLPAGAALALDGHRQVEPEGATLRGQTVGGPQVGGPLHRPGCAFGPRLASLKSSYSHGEGHVDG